MRTSVTMLLVALVGVGTGTALRHLPLAAGDAAPAPAAPRPPARTRPVTGVMPPVLTRELLGARGDSAVVAAVRGRDCLTCEDLGRQLRQLVSAVGGGMPVVIAMPARDSVRVKNFVRTERIRNVDLAVFTVPLKLQDGSIVPTPAAMVVGRDGRVRRGIAHVERERNVRAVSFAHELGFLPTTPVPPPIDPSQERNGKP